MAEISLAQSRVPVGSAAPRNWGEWLRRWDRIDESAHQAEVGRVHALWVLSCVEQSLNVREAAIAAPRKRCLRSTATKYSAFPITTSANVSNYENSGPDQTKESPNESTSWMPAKSDATICSKKFWMSPLAERRRSREQF